MIHLAGFFLPPSSYFLPRVFPPLVFPFFAVMFPRFPQKIPQFLLHNKGPNPGRTLRKSPDDIPLSPCPRYLCELRGKLPPISLDPPQQLSSPGFQSDRKAPCWLSAYLRVTPTARQTPSLFLCFLCRCRRLFQATQDEESFAPLVFMEGPFSYPR